MKTYEQWREHYNYEDNEKSREDYKKYKNELEFFESMKDEAESDSDSMSMG